MSPMVRRFQSARRQSGAALAIGLVLLAVLTLLAITGMNTASTELTMAGNEQFRQNAFQAAETGVETALSVLDTVPQSGATVTVGPVAVPGSPNDQFQTTSRFVGSIGNVEKYSEKFTALLYRVQSIGTSSRNASSQHEVGAYLVAGGSSNGDSFGALGGPGR